MRKPRPCVILGSEYEWEPYMDNSFALRKGHDVLVKMWGRASRPVFSIGGSENHKYEYSFEDAARILETKYLTGAIDDL